MLIIAHRGASALAKENTLEAFQLAEELGAHAVETDVRRCRTCRDLFLSHDALKSCRAHGSVARFKDFLDFGQWMELHIELKEKNLLWDVLKLARKVRFFHKIVFSSFLWKELWKLKFLEPSARVALLYGDETKKWPIWAIASFAKLLGAESINIDFGLLDKSVVRYFQRRGFKVCAYTVNSEENLIHAHFLGLDGIFTDNPAYAEEVTSRIIIQ